jgi:Cyclin, N-terminal domain
MFEVVDHFNFDRELVGIAMDFLDRSVSRSSVGPVGEREYQLSAIASVFLAVKLHNGLRSDSGGRLQLGLGTLVELSRRNYTEDLIQEAERKIASSVDWYLNPPTPLQYITHSLRLLPRWSDSGPLGMSSYREFVTAVYDTAKYLTEVASFSLALAFEADASTIAYATLLSATSIVEATMQFPQDAHRDWLERLRDVHHTFTPSNATVQMAQRRIEELCPGSFLHSKQPEVIAPEGDQKRARDSRSPTCVQDYITAHESPTKRHRTDDLEGTRPDSFRAQKFSSL